MATRRFPVGWVLLAAPGAAGIARLSAEVLLLNADYWMLAAVVVLVPALLSLAAMRRRSDFPDVVCVLLSVGLALTLGLALFWWWWEVIPWAWAVLGMTAPLMLAASRVAAACPRRAPPSPRGSRVLFLVIAVWVTVLAAFFAGVLVVVSI